ncbi:MAG: hypothetical protein MZU97_06860 [Bacillus subtilis]|nr:hypothetical protein [Bacillus subtilis]
MAPPKASVFTVYAPHARIVSVVGDFNRMGFAHARDGEDRSRSASSSLFIAETRRVDEVQILHRHQPTDRPSSRPTRTPCSADFRPETASKVYDIEGYVWHDDDLSRRSAATASDEADKPIAIYEVHLGTWMTQAGQARSTSTTNWSTI